LKFAKRVSGARRSRRLKSRSELGTTSFAFITTAAAMAWVGFIDIGIPLSAFAFENGSVDGQEWNVNRPIMGSNIPEIAMPERIASQPTQKILATPLDD
jgi:hypothetical protein